ncbi:hypothetical protein NLI96_g8952 [Meripilus lineatus]|uniref:Uncharacterized protein n=1 Tax=Meripilus lineatus TaxID=2056292 RepID=A0AAD5V1N6_9APHY|nr:hypothetical protein NLI96_g8952 [Physisporinus lineatus]
MTSTIRPDKHHVISRESGFLLGRGPEDKSMKPKKVMTLPPGMDRVVFDMIPLNTETGLYRITCDGAPLISVNRKLYAMIDDSKEPDEWYLIKAEAHGPNAYVFVPPLPSSSRPISIIFSNKYFLN